MSAVDVTEVYEGENSTVLTANTVCLILRKKKTRTKVYLHLQVASLRMDFSVRKQFVHSCLHKIF